ncbi:MAG: hypothetical protein V4654_00165 [Bdellovibrionota bacterium]
MFKKLILITLGLLLVGCDYSYKRGEDKTKSDQVTQAEVLTYAMVNERVIQPRCVQCHSESSGNKGNINLESYDAILKNRTAIRNEISDRTMPPSSKAPLTGAQAKLVLDWIDQGAYEDGAPIQLPTNPGETSGTVGTVEADPTLIADLKKPLQFMPDAERLKLEVEAIAKTKNLEIVSGAVYPQLMVTAEGYTVLIADAERTALLYESHTDAFEFKLKLDLTENLCQAEYVKPQCNFHFDLSNDGMVFRWIKHSDEQKIGQIVKMKFSGNGDEQFVIKKTDVIYGFIDRFVGRKNDLRFKPDLIVCDRYDWLDKKLENNKSEANVTAKFASWSTESMVLNSETGVNENATAAVFENITWKLEKNALVMQGLERIQSNSNFGKFTPIIPAGQASTIQYIQANGETCQFSFGHSIQALVAGVDFDKYFSAYPRFVVHAKPKSAAYKVFDLLQGKSLQSPFANAEFE